MRHPADHAAEQNARRRRTSAHSHIGAPVLQGVHEVRQEPERCRYHVDLAWRAQLHRVAHTCGDSLHHPLGPLAPCLASHTLVHLALCGNQVVLAGRQAKEVGREASGCRRKRVMGREVGSKAVHVWGISATLALQPAGQPTEHCMPSLHSPLTHHGTHAPLMTIRNVRNSQDTANTQNSRMRSGEGGPRLSSRASGCGASGALHSENGHAGSMPTQSLLCSHCQEASEPELHAASCV